MHQAGRRGREPQPGRLTGGRRNLRGALAATPGRLSTVCRPGAVVLAADGGKSPMSGLAWLFWHVLDWLDYCFGT
jgi:hypothetical protein